MAALEYNTGSTAAVNGLQQVDATHPLPVAGITTAAAAATLSNVAASATNVTLLAANASRRGASIYNDGTANLLVKHGATASATSFTYKIPAGGLYELPQPVYTGIVDGIWDAANGNARLTEAT